MGCLLCCFGADEVDQEQEGFDHGQQIQQPNAISRARTEVGSSQFVHNIAVECDARVGKGTKGVNLSQVQPELVLEKYTSDNPKIVTKCSHHYHLGCILTWQERSEFCPVCSRVMVFEEMN
ncbi:hypothetical protein LXL04_011070 [Taraxacum kok-saghyz]